MPPIVATALLLIGSNIFMTFAWYAHLKNLGTKPLMVAVLASWGIAFFEYLIQVPANRIGFTQLTSPTAQDAARSYHTVGLRAVQHLVHEPADPPRLPLGRPLPLWRRLLHVPRRGPYRMISVFAAVGIRH